MMKLKRCFNTYTEEKMMIKFLIQRPIAVSVILFAFIVMSLVAAGLIPVSLMPGIDIPEIIVRMDVPGKPAREMEEQHVSKVRRQLLQVSHLSDIESSASNGQGNIRLVFDYGTSINYALIEVNEKIDALMPAMPEEFVRPRVIKTSATDIPVFYLDVSLKDSLEDNRFTELSEFCEQVIKKRVEQLPEVAMADISGLERAEIVLQADMEQLGHLGIDRSTFTNALETNNYSVGNIKVRDGLYEFNVRYASPLKNRDDIENLYITSGSRIFRLKDLAGISIRSNPDQGIFLSGNARSVVMAVIKKSNARISSLKEKTNELVSRLQEDYPRLSFRVERNQTELLDYSLRNLKSGLLAGGLLSFLLMLLFLKDMKSPLLIGISVPVSLLISLMFFYLLGISVNIISLSGLILGSGMMIDNSIIVIDNIAQYREKGDSVFKSCIKGTGEVIRPLISSVLTTCAVFVPLIFLSGISGALFYDQAMAVTIGLGVSLIVSFTVIPVYFRLFYRESQRDKDPDKKTGNPFGKIMDRISLYSHIEESYSTGFDVAFRYRGIILVLVLLVIAAACVVFGQIKKEKFPAFKQTDAVVKIDWNRNITVEENHKRVGLFLSQNDSLLESSSCMIGPQDFLLDRTAGQGASEAELYIRAKTEEDLMLVADRFKSYCRESYPEAAISVVPPPNLFEKVFNSQSAPLELRVKNKTGEGLPDPEVIRDITSKVTQKAGIQVKDPLRLQDYFMILPDHERLLLYRVSIDELVSVLKKAFNRLQIFTLRQGQSQVPVFLSGRDQSLDQVIRSVKVRSENKQDIPVSSLVSIRENIDYKELQGGKSGIFVALDYDARQKQSKAITRAYREVLKSYPGIDMEVKGSLLDNITLLKEMTVILLVSLLLLYLILAAQFESLLQPLIVLIEIPVDLGGALIVLWLTGNSLNLMAFVGLIVITGIVINDSILKIDTINRLMKGNLPVMEAIHLGGTRRLKPIIMTSATTILAMIPLFFSDDLGSRLQQPLAIVVIAGMSIGTLVSLYFVPLCYYYLIKNKQLKEDNQN